MSKMKRKRTKTKTCTFREFSWDNRKQLTIQDVQNNDVRFYKKLKQGDLILTDQYRGHGVYFYDGSKLFSSLGEYGYFMPPEAWPFVEKFGPEYFESCGCEYFLIPRGSHVIYKLGDKEEMRFIWYMTHKDAYLLSDFLVDSIGKIVASYVEETDWNENSYFWRNSPALAMEQNNESDYTIVNGRKFNQSLLVYR